MTDYFALTRNGHDLVDMLNLKDGTLDIRSNGLYPSNVLSNMCDNAFIIDGVECASMESFLQSLKQSDPFRQEVVCAMGGFEAKTSSNHNWQEKGILWWRGEPIERLGAEYQRLLRRAYNAMFEQCFIFRAALMGTRGLRLIHSSGCPIPEKTILTPDEFCSILTNLRDDYHPVYY